MGVLLSLISFATSAPAIPRHHHGPTLRQPSQIQLDDDDDEREKEAAILDGEDEKANAAGNRRRR